MFIVITYETISRNLINSIISMFFYNNNTKVINITNLFLYSKYVEWLDTLFLQLSEKTYINVTIHTSYDYCINSIYKYC